MNAEPLQHMTPAQRSRYSAWAEAIARAAKSNRIADRFQAYADAASDDGSFYGSTPDFNAASRG